MVAATSAASRPIDKSLIVLNEQIGTAQTDITLLTADAPCTIMGLRWKLNYSGTINGFSEVYWAIYRLKETYTAPTLSTTSNTSFLEPEQEVLTWGVSMVADTDGGVGPGISYDKGSSKTMRKLMKGDRLVLSLITDAQSPEMAGIVQFFCKF